MEICAPKRTLTLIEAKQKIGNFLKFLYETEELNPQEIFETPYVIYEIAYWADAFDPDENFIITFFQFKDGTILKLDPELYFEKQIFTIFKKDYTLLNKVDKIFSVHLITNQHIKNYVVVYYVQLTEELVEEIRKNIIQSKQIEQFIKELMKKI